MRSPRSLYPEIARLLDFRRVAVIGQQAAGSDGAPNLCACDALSQSRNFDPPTLPFAHTQSHCAKYSAAATRPSSCSFDGTRPTPCPLQLRPRSLNRNHGSWQMGYVISARRALAEAAHTDRNRRFTDIPPEDEESDSTPPSSPPAAPAVRRGKFDDEEEDSDVRQPETGVAPARHSPEMPTLTTRCRC